MGIVVGSLGKALALHVPGLHLIVTSTMTLLAAGYGAAEICGKAWWVPTRHWQVPRHWGQHGTHLYWTAFGLALGAGFFTIVTSMGYYVLLVIGILLGDPAQAATLMALFGAARVAPVLIMPLLVRTRGVADPFAFAIEANAWLTLKEQRLAVIRGSVLLVVAGMGVVQALAAV